LSYRGDISRVEAEKSEEVACGKLGGGQGPHSIVPWSAKTSRKGRAKSRGKKKDKGGPSLGKFKKPRSGCSHFEKKRKAFGDQNRRKGKRTKKSYVGIRGITQCRGKKKIMRAFLELKK